MIVLHYTGMADNEAARQAAVHSPASEVSAHYVVLQDGYIIQMVAEERRAWHAGAVVLGRRDRHQLVLDRHRDRQSRA